MPQSNERQIEVLVTANELTLNNALSDAEIAALLEKWGYPAARIEEGLTLVRLVRIRQEARLVAYGAQLAATDRFREAFAAARTAYADLRETARAHFRSAAQNREVWQTLRLGGAMTHDTEKFIGMAYATCDAALANPEIVAALALYGYDEAGLQATRAVIEALAAANQAQERAKGDSQWATAQRNEACRAMKAWMGTFKRVTRRALKDRGDLSVKLRL